MATFDLQSVLRIPSDDTSQMYHSRKLCEIASALLCWFNSVPETVKEVYLYSDTCTGQNRKQNIAALCMFLINNSHN
ncbi:hypothetical protein PR048_022093 [Dryococelus australis]|uniref:Uncharacterized protein n=1 Tax=Dryococelus australis TaxID=614101 RepID=A0ABQ9H024_9NEOP|nr:hypothetical protein PR048_022093 [Dryococelus australis]